MSDRIRPAESADLAALVRIYNHYVTHSHVTFDTEPFAIEERRAWLDGFGTSGPHRLLVLEDAGAVQGYASSGVFRGKPAYRRSVETSIYVAPEVRERGVGRRLYAALLDELDREPEVHRAAAGIALPNPGSIALHESLGFSVVGTFRSIGYKHERYWDVVWYERPCP
ncbi:MAG: GNAT family N-acetyltransferase [Myxococcota bacterium]|nr:GNAT family N-acetyltransferase [Myxococcota bacterium]